MRRFSCDEARSQLSDALAGEIGRPEANVLEAHLLECDPCRSLSELFIWQDRVIAELAAQARLETLVSKVREGLAHLDQVSVAGEERPRLDLSRFRKWIPAAAVLLLALLALRFWRPRPAEQPPLTPGVEEAKVVPVPPPLPEQSESSAKTPEEVPPTPVPDPPPAAPAKVAQEPPKPPPAAPVSSPLRPEAPIAKDPVLQPPAHVAVVPGPAKPDVVQRPRSLEEAVRGGMAYLRVHAAAFTRESKAEELLMWTYLQAGVTESDPEFQTLLKSILEKKLERTYTVAFTAMVLEDLDRAKYQKRIAQCAQFLLDNQCANGQWSYGEPTIFAEDLNVPPVPPKFKGIRKVAVVRKRDGPAAGDNSNSMYAMLGLRACHDAGIILPREAVLQAAKWWRETQTRLSPVKAPAVPPEGWCYGKHDHKPYGSMTVGGIGSLVICDYILSVDWKKDPQVASGMEWLARNFSVTYNPGPYEHAGMEENSQHQYYYYMYGLERAAILYGTEQIGGNYWFARGLQVLLDSQRPDGSWKSAAGGSEVNDTCFAILFLRKATRSLPDVATPGAGPRK